MELHRILKYLIEGVAIMISAHLLQGKKLKIRQLLVLGATAAVVHLILDEFAPAVGSASRTGSGLALGVQMAGGQIPMVEGYCGEQ